MTTQISDRDKKLLLILAGVLIFVLIYFVGATRIQDATDVIRSENDVLRQQASLLAGLDANKAAYQKNTDTYLKQIKSYQQMFPAEVRAEDEIAFAHSFEQSTPAGDRALINYVATPDPVAVTLGTPATENLLANQNDITGEIAANAFVNDGSIPDTTQMQMNVVTSNISYNVTYNGLKTILQQISKSDKRKAVQDITMAFDENTGKLSGTIDINYYAMTGLGNEYTEPADQSVPQGTSDIFHSVTITQRTQAAAGTTATEAGTTDTTAGGVKTTTGTGTATTTTGTGTATTGTGTTATGTGTATTAGAVN